MKPSPRHEIDADRWPHLREIGRRSVYRYGGSDAFTIDFDRPGFRSGETLSSEMEDWLRNTVEPSGWRYSASECRANFGDEMAMIIITFRLHFARAEDAFAYKMRWL